jgi:hypothetical protein
MFTEEIYQPSQSCVPDISLEIIRHTDLGDRVICAICKANGLEAKRLTQDIYGQPVNKIPVWNIQGRIVADWFALLLESKYQQAVGSEPVIIHPDFV